MSDTIEQEIQDATDLVGQVSDEETPGKGWFSDFSIYEGMLLASLICILLAIFLMFRELQVFGNPLSEWVWRAKENLGLN